MLGWGLGVGDNRVCGSACFWSCPRAWRDACSRGTAPAPLPVAVGCAPRAPPSPLSMQRVVEEVNAQFRNDELTTFVCVCIPEFLSLYETERLIQELAKFEIDSRNIVINQVIFPEEGEPAGCARAGGTPPLMALCQLRCPSVVPASGSCVPCFLCTCFAVLHFRGAAGMVGTDWTGQVAAPPAQPHSSRAGPRCSGQQPAAGGARAHAAEVPGPVLRPLRGLPPRAPAAAGRGGGEGGAVGLRRGGRCRAAAGLGW
jgi:hypothetical protein